MFASRGANAEKGMVTVMKTKSRIACLISILTAMSFLLCLPDVSAASASALNLHYQIDSVPIEGVEVTAYKIAACSSDDNFGLTDDFKNYNVNPNVSRDTEDWDILAETLYGYTVADKISPTYTSTSDKNGFVGFDSVGDGMYLVVSSDVSQDGKIIKFAPALTAITGDSDDLSVYPKGEMVEPSSNTITYKVIKLWKDNGSDSRPENIEIAVSRDGETVDHKILSQDNNWTYTWTVERDGSTWSVTEVNVPNNYTVTVENRNSTFVLTNTKSSEDVPPSPGTPPQTGDPLMKYVMLAAGSGLCMILLGLTMRKRRES